MDKDIWLIPKKAFFLLKRNDPLRMAGATAFFTSFSLPFIVIILVQLFGLVLNRQELSIQLFRNLANIVGNPGEQQIQDISRGFRRLATNGYVASAGFVFLLFVVTTLFKVIKDSIHQLWQVKKTKGQWWSGLLPRLKAIGLILLIGILLLLDLAAESLLAVIRYDVAGFRPDNASLIFKVIHQLISFVIITGWMLSLFLYLPDSRFSLRVTMKGALLTGGLYTVGKLLLKWLLVSSNIHRVYGTAGAFVVILLFVFYIALILYFGAAFTAVLAEHYGEATRSARHPRIIEQ